MKTTILPINDLDDLAKVAAKEQCNTVGIEEMSVTYIQQADTCSDPDDVQLLKLTTRCGVSPGMSDLKKKHCFYYNLEIPEGKYFSIDSAADLEVIIKDFESRVYMVTEAETADEKSGQTESV